MRLALCGACGGLARAPASPLSDLRGRACPRWGTVHRACCAAAVCSFVDARGHVRCDWARGGRERVLAETIEAAKT